MQLAGVEVTLRDNHCFRSQVVLVGCTCDLPARAQLTNVVQFNGYYDACVALKKVTSIQFCKILNLHYFLLIKEQ